MKTILNLLPMAIVALGLGLSSCSSERNATPDEGGVTVELSSSIDNVRVTSTDGLVYSWESGDQIGITSSSLNGKNVAYNAQQAGTATVFAPTPDAEAYKIPFNNDGPHDIKAYYPYATTSTDEIIVNLSTNSKPLLYAEGSVSKTSPAVALNFKHKLGMLRIAIDATAVGADASTATVKAKGLLSQATFNITNGTLNNGTQTANIDLNRGGNEFYAFLLPGEVLKDKEVSIALDGKEYKATLTSATPVQAGKYYKYTITLSTGDTTTSVENTTIEDMTEGENNTIDGAPVTPGTPPTPAPVEATLSGANSNFDATSNTLSVAATAGNYTLTLSGLETGTTVTGTASPSAPWITLNGSTLRATSDQTLNIQIAENATTTERTTEVTLKANNMKDLTFTVKQAAKEKTVDPEPEPQPETPAVTEGDGTEAKPFSVAQAIKNQDRSGVYVKGYIVGVFNKNKFDPKGTSTTNIAIADSPDETKNVMPIELPKGSVRTELNIKDHPENKSRQVVLKGTLTKYFGQSGLKSTTEYKLL